MRSEAKSVEQYLSELPKDRRAAISAVRDVVAANIDKNIEEGIHYGMITWCIPHRIFPDGYHTTPGQPLPYASLASQKNYMTLYLMTEWASPGGESWFRKEWAKSGKKLDKGKTCIHFKTVDDLALDVIGETLRRMPMKKFIEQYETWRPAPKVKAKPRVKAKATPRAKAKKASRKK